MADIDGKFVVAVESERRLVESRVRVDFSLPSLPARFGGYPRRLALGAQQSSPSGVGNVLKPVVTLNLRPLWPRPGKVDECESRTEMTVSES